MTADMEGVVDALTGVRISVASMNGKLDGIVSMQADHAGQLAAIQQWRWTLTGRLSTLSGIWGAIGGAIAGAIAGAVLG